MLDRACGYTDSITMANVKTAISIPAELFKQVERYSKKKKIPRSRVFADAVRKLLRDQSDKEITRRLNEVYSDPEVQKEQAEWARLASQSMARLLEKIRALSSGGRAR